MQTDPTKCKCWIRPFEPPAGCYDYCGGKILRFTSLNDMQEYLHFDEQLCYRVYEVTANSNLTTLSDIKLRLEEDDAKQVDFRMRNLDQRALEWLRVIFEHEEDVTTETREPVPVS